MDNNARMQFFFPCKALKTAAKSCTKNPNHNAFKTQNCEIIEKNSAYFVYFIRIALYVQFFFLRNFFAVQSITCPCAYFISPG